MAVRDRDGRTPPRWDNRLQEERVTYGLGIKYPSEGNADEERSL